MVLKTIKKLTTAAVVANIAVFSIYWFELDTKFIRSFEPTFRKGSDLYKRYFD